MATNSTMVWAPLLLTTRTEPGSDFSTASRRAGGACCSAEIGTKPRSPPRGADCGSSEKSAARSPNATPSFRRVISICVFATASCGVLASLPVRLATSASATGVTAICAMWYASSGRLNCALLALKKSVTSWSVTVTLVTTSRSTTFCASMSRRSASRMSAAVRPRAARLFSKASGVMFFLPSSNALSTSVSASSIFSARALSISSSCTISSLSSPSLAEETSSSAGAASACAVRR